MSYVTEYTTHFHSLAGVRWDIDIEVNKPAGQAMEISLDADSPVTIDWQETKLSDIVQASICTLKVVNAKDRQMATLMMHRYARLKIRRNGTIYWIGLLDDAVYEEPYSYKDDYVAELTFSDFGILNRVEYTPDGVRSLLEIVNTCLATASLDSLSLTQAGSLTTPKGTAARLETMYINTKRFEGMTMMDTLDGVLRALGMRIVQRNGTVYVYDLDNLFANYPVVPVAWMGSDARLKGSETYGGFELKFDRMSEPDIANGSMDPDKANWVASDRYFAPHFGMSIYTETGFIVQMGKFFASNLPQLPSLLTDTAKYFTTRSYLTDSHDAGVARRICCYDRSFHKYRNLLEKSTPWNPNQVSGLFSIESRFIPVVPDAQDYQLRVNLSILFSPKYNPFEDSDGQANIDHHVWDEWKERLTTVYVPVKLELVDNDGNTIMHYRNAKVSEHKDTYLEPLGLLKGEWASGSASWNDMVLSYYKDGLDENPLDGWADNRMTIEENRIQLPDLYKKRKNGEYLPLPSRYGRLRLTIGQGILTKYDHNSDFTDFNLKIRWQLYRDPMITVVYDAACDDAVDSDDVVEIDIMNENDDSYSESHIIGCHCDGISPASIGMMTYGTGAAVGDLVKNGIRGTLLKHRLNALEDQLSTTHSTLSGTAALEPGMCLRSDASTQGKFLVTGTMQDLREDTEELTMVRISAGQDRYGFSWSAPVCVIEPDQYMHSWSNPVCVRYRQAYAFAWSVPVCVRKNITISPVWGEF